MKRPERLSILLFLVVVVVGALLSRSIGPAWDEPDNMFAGGVYWNFFAQGFNPAVFDTSKDTSSFFGGQVYPLDRNIWHLPPVYNYIGTAFAVAEEHFGAPKTGATVIVAYHMMTVLFLGLLVVMTYNVGLLMGLGPSWSLFAAASALLYPTLFGHGLSDSKDTAQAALFITSLYFLVRASLKENRKDLILGGIVWGLGMATKFNAIYVPIIWVAWRVITSCGGRLPFSRTAARNSLPSQQTRSVHLVRSIHGLTTEVSALVKRVFRLFSSIAILRKRQIALHMFSQRNFSLIGDFVLVLFIGLLTAFLVWPYLWFTPLKHAMDVVQYFTNVGRGYKFYWEGHVYESGLGVSYWWYPLGSFLFGTPVPFLLCIFLGFVSVFGSLKQHKERILLIIWIIIPFLRAFLPWASLYDQLRHFVETIPAFALVAACFLSSLSRTRWKQFAIVVGGIVILHLAFINVLYFPYSAGYWNVLTPNPNKNFDRDVEALSVKEGVEYLHKKYGSFTAFIPIGAHLSWYYLGPHDGTFDYYHYENADSIIMLNKSSHASNDSVITLVKDTYYIDHVIRRGNAIFAWIYRKKI